MFPDVFQRINCSCPMMFSKQFSIALPKGSLGTWEQTVRNKGQNFGEKGKTLSDISQVFLSCFARCFLANLQMFSHTANTSWEAGVAEVIPFLLVTLVKFVTLVISSIFTICTLPCKNQEKKKCVKYSVFA